MLKGLGQLLLGADAQTNERVGNQREAPGNPSRSSGARLAREKLGCGRCRRQGGVARPQGGRGRPRPGGGGGGGDEGTGDPHLPPGVRPPRRNSCLAATLPPNPAPEGEQAAQRPRALHVFRFLLRAWGPPLICRAVTRLSLDSGAGSGDAWPPVTHTGVCRECGGNDSALPETCTARFLLFPRGAPPCRKSLRGR